MKKLIIITTVPMSLATLVKGQAKYLSSYFDVKLVTSFSEKNQEISKAEGVELKSIDMTRQITIIKDLKALIELYKYFKNQKPDIVYTFTPKAGLLGMMASFLSRVPVRIHNVVGMPLMEATGKKFILLKFIERLTYFFSTNLFCNSFGLKKFINENLTKKDVKVIAQGSINGVDTEFFKNTKTLDEKELIRDKFKIDKKDFVITFVGRIVKDKGINELIEAFINLSKKYNNLKLLLVGDYEEHLNPIKKENKILIDSLDSIITVGFQNDIRDFLSITDLFVLPSYREGLPNSLIEAGSFGIPLLAANINGCNEIIDDGITGILVEKKSAKKLEEAIDKLLEDKELYNSIKLKVRDRIIEKYEQKYFWNELKNEIKKSI
ncbi:glycosyltransferase family 4 protein [Aliarcobacter cryaerophilus]|uniref:glycosyltransferase family 4 protein n=1 Tax=Aliarcobacter cryaerophilus TaxID=28198 RepID=UPI0021B15A86|nr:glycosyltransferase family 4 protein [Aliarcobacter cryaerophilus]MCT7495750.1 glycosyltransferase family 4 protein [Aliarcobacter cryaerophilus]